MTGLMGLLRRPLVQLLAITILIAGGAEAYKHVKQEKRRAMTMESESNRIRERGSELKRLAAVAGELEKTFASGEDPIQGVQRIAAEEGLNLASTQADGIEEKENGFTEEKFTFRLKNAPLASALRMISAVESSRPGTLIRDLQIRRNVASSEKVDVDFQVTLLTGRAH